MKGAIFIALNNMVEKDFGIQAWEEILQTVKPTSQGIYTSTEDYDDAEIIAFVHAISEKLKIPPQDVTRVFGKFLFQDLNSKHPMFSKLQDNLFDFLASIEDVIHREVRKLYENPNLPKIDCRSEDDTQLDMKYTSPRKLCYLAEGLIFGAAEYYRSDISIEHNTCLHKGDDHCLIRVTLNGR